MKLKKKDKNLTELNQITDGELWTIYWALKSFVNRGQATKIAVDLADTIYNGKLRDLDPGYNQEQNKEAILRRNKAILNTLQGMIPVQPAGVSPSRGF